MTESKMYPKIERSRRERMVFFPDNIQKMQKVDMEGFEEDFYRYDLIKIPDKAQCIEDYVKFKEENEVELTEYALGEWREETPGKFLFEAMV